MAYALWEPKPEISSQNSLFHQDGSRTVSYFILEKFPWPQKALVFWVYFCLGYEKLKITLKLLKES